MIHDTLKGPTSTLSHPGLLSIKQVEQRFLVSIGGLTVSFVTPGDSDNQKLFQIVLIGILS